MYSDETHVFVFAEEGTAVNHGNLGKNLMMYICIVTNTIRQTNRTDIHRSAQRNSAFQNLSSTVLVPLLRGAAEQAKQESIGENGPLRCYTAADVVKVGWHERTSESIKTNTKIN